MQTDKNYCKSVCVTFDHANDIWGEFVMEVSKIESFLKFNSNNEK
jgi:hypothetical protein